MPKKDLFSSSSSSDDGTSDNDNLSRQMAVAAAVAERRNPHAYAPASGRRKGKLRGGAVAATTLDSSDDDGSEAEADNAAGASAAAASGVSTCKADGTGAVGDGGKGQKNRKRKDDSSGANTVANDGDCGEGIRINQKYAAKYEEVKRRKELQKLTQKYGDQLYGAHGGDNSESDEEDEEDDDAVLLTESKELAFAKAFLAIRQASLAKKQEGERAASSREAGVTETVPGERRDEGGSANPLGVECSFFPPPEEQVRENTEVFSKAVVAKRMQRKKFTLADEYRRGIVTSAGDDNAGENDECCEAIKDESAWGNRRIQPQSERERQLRESFLQNVAESSESFSVKPAVSSSDDRQEGKAECEAKRLLAGAFSIRVPRGGEATTEGDGATSGIDANEEFLRDFFVEELWKPENNRKGGKKGSKTLHRGDSAASAGVKAESEIGDDDGGDSDYDGYEEGNNYAALAELAQAEEDERFFAEAEVWERKFQERAYRHQEENADHIQSFPRPIGSNAEGLLRKSATSSRKEAHLRRIARMRELREQQVAELRRLKTLKRQEIEEQRALIASVAGISRERRQKSRMRVKDAGSKPSDDDNEDAAVKRLMSLWSEKDLDEEFDPRRFDSKMAEIFDDTYYDEKNVDEEEMAFFEDEEDGDADGEGKDEGEREDAQGSEKASDGGGEGFSERKTTGRKGTARKSVTFAADEAMELLYPSIEMPEAGEVSTPNSREHIELMMQAEKGRANPTDPDEVLQQLQTTLRQKEKEYWQLHHESTLGGGSLKTRFKYRRVVPENFTLSVEEILAQDDRQLNMLVPMNCYAAYLSAEDNRRDRIRADKRRRRGFREIDSSRSSRRYGDVSKTSLVDLNMKEEEGEKWAENVRKSLQQLQDRMDLDRESVDGGCGIHDDGALKGVRKSKRNKSERQQQQTGEVGEREKKAHTNNKGDLPAAPPGRNVPEKRPRDDKNTPDFGDNRGVGSRKQRIRDSRR